MTTSVPEHTLKHPVRKVRGIAFTQPNWTEESYAALQKFGTEQCLYMVLGKEICPTTGTPHIQGFLYFENPRAYPNQKFRAISQGAHDEMTYASPRNNADYCKEDGDFWEFGEVPSQGARTDWDAAHAQLQNGSVADTINTQPHLIPCIRALERYKQISEKGSHRDVKVYVFYGSSGTGKTRDAWELNPELYSKPDGNWFDGYSGQDCLLLDDYQGDLPYTWLLKILDRYPIQLPVKGGFVTARYTKVIITTNVHPRHWYGGNYDALKRRIIVVNYRHNHAPQISPDEEACVPQAAGTDPSPHQ